MEQARVKPAEHVARPLTLVLMTQTFPYDGASEQTFLAPEIEHLVASFNLILAPEARRGTRLPVPPEVQVDESYVADESSGGRRLRIALRALVSSSLFRDILNRPSILVQYPAFKWLLAFAGRAVQTRSWLKRFLDSRDLDPGQCLFYTYWLDSSALGIGLAKRDYPGIKLVSRAHGYDLYEARHQPSYIPCRRESLQLLDGLFPDSDQGSRYIAQRFPGVVPYCETARLGVDDPGFITAPSSDGIFRIVSCSFLVPVKRVALLLKGIACAARRRPQQRFEWHHFGDGPLKGEIETLASSLPPNVTSHLPGYPSPAGLMAFYRDNPIDVFVNLSESEGTPVAVMEAISCGMPIVATAVGGNPEIVSDRNGNLISANPDPDEIADALMHVWDHPDIALEKRQASREVWKRRYKADDNFRMFAERLLSIRRQV